MTLQEIFNKAVNGIREQGGLGVSASGICSYQTSGGRRCAIGHLLDDEQLRMVIDREALTYPFDYINSFLHLANRLTAEWRLMRDLQIDHDGSKNLDEFLDKARVLAERYEVKMPG